jgi:5-methyltetrahydropteroyltriglutamate--homocysteine methyltransferase
MTRPKKLNPPFRADHVGSLLRPNRLLEARERAGLAAQGADEHRGRGDLSLAELRRVEDDCIREAVGLQESVGLRSITDGEFRRASWAYDLTARIDGVVMKRQEGAFKGAFSGSGSRPPLAYTAGKVRRKPEGLVVEDFKFVQALTDRTVKVTLPSPTLMYVRGGRASVSEAAYPDIEEFFADLTGVYREEIAALAAAGCTYVQIDNTDIAYINDPRFQEMARRQGMEPRDQAKLQGRLISMATRGRPESMTVSMHMCRGNSAGNWMAEGGYDFVAETLFNDFDVDAFFMEYDSPRAGDFTPLRFAPRDKLIVLGLVTTKTPENDTRSTLMRRIDEAGRYVPIDNLALSPQCGFASVARGNPIGFDDQRRKLELVVEVAEEVWGSA